MKTAAFTRAKNLATTSTLSVLSIWTTSLFLDRHLSHQMRWFSLIKDNSSQRINTKTCWRKFLIQSAWVRSTMRQSTSAYRKPKVWSIKAVMEATVTGRDIKRMEHKILIPKSPFSSHTALSNMFRVLQLIVWTMEREEQRQSHQPTMLTSLAPLIFRLGIRLRQLGKETQTSARAIQC